MLHGVLGLSRDPFAATCDDDLYWEDPVRGEVRQRIQGFLRAGQGVWIRGGPDSGRRTLLGRAVESLAREGRPVAWCEGSAVAAEGAPEGVLHLLGRVMGAPVEEDERFVLEGVCERLVEGFCRGGPVLAVLAGDALDQRDRELLEFLAGLRLVGRPLVTWALWGAAPPPFAGLQELCIPPVSASALQEALAQRAAACGRPELLAPERLERISAIARSLSHALSLARAEMEQVAFLCGAERGKAHGPDVAAREGVLDPLALDEVNRLLHALGSPEAAPG